jgi:hypothetical protein
LNGICVFGVSIPISTVQQSVAFPHPTIKKWTIPFKAIIAEKDSLMKKSYLKYASVAAAIGLASCHTASACALLFRVPVPEIDPSMAVGSFTLIAGTIAVLRARRKK